MDQVQGGRISVKTRLMSESAKILIDEKKRLPGNIQIIVSDNGPGIDETIKETLFDPYTTTKPEGSNSGLGLSIVYRILEAYDCRMDVNSTPGQGSVFSLLFKAAEGN